MNAAKMAEDLKLKVGDFFTLVRWLHILDRSWQGDCMEVKVLDYPFVRATIHKKGWMHGHTITLNLNEIEIMPLSMAFVNSVKEEIK